MKYFAFLFEKRHNNTIEAMEYSTIIEMNRRISMQMVAPMSRQHHNNHLENNNENKMIILTKI